MKKFTKICLVTSAVLIIIGGTICILGAVSGGWKMINGLDRSSAVWRLVHRLEGMWEAEDEIKNAWEEAREEAQDAVEEARGEAEDTMEEARAEMEEARMDMAEARYDMKATIEEELMENVPLGDGDTGIASSQVKNMRIEIGGASLCLMESENDHFGVKIDGKGKYNYYESGGEFYLEGGKKRWSDLNNERVYLYVPQGKTFDKVEIDVGGGIINIGELDANTVDLTAGAGIIYGERISCRKLDVEVGAGEAVLYGIEADKMGISVGMGTASIQGRVGKELDAECGMGSLKMELDNAETDFNYEIECSAGGITLGNQTYHPLTDGVIVDNHAERECSLECSMGSITVVFNQ